MAELPLIAVKVPCNQLLCWGRLGKVLQKHRVGKKKMKCDQSLHS